MTKNIKAVELIPSETEQSSEAPLTKPTPQPIEAQPEPKQTPTETPRDIFDDLSQLRLDQNFTEMAGVKKLLTTVPVRKPHPQEFVRVHPDPAYRETLAVIEFKADRELFLVTPSVANELPGEFYMAVLFTAVNRQGVVFLWPVRLPSADGRIMEWHRSAAEAAERAMMRWVRVKANMDLGAYEISEALNVTSEPQLPTVSYNELLRIALRDRLITTMDHPVIKRLRGLA